MVTNKKKFIVPNTYVGKRADLVIHTLMPEYSRAKIQSWIKKGFIKIDLENFTNKLGIVLKKAKSKSELKFIHIFS
jgi:23S rRNA-/tRNA-specific pseudouridylate synthase